MKCPPVYFVSGQLSLDDDDDNNNNKIIIIAKHEDEMSDQYNDKLCTSNEVIQ